MIDLLVRSQDILLKGISMTLLVVAVSAPLSFSFGLFFGIYSSKKLRKPILSKCIDIVTFAYRAIPFYIQLLIVYYVLPDLLGYNFAPFPASVLALGMCSSGYVSQIVKAGLNSIPISQWEVAFSLGYTQWETLRWIVLPQMVRNVLPALTNELDSLLKSTSIVSSIGLLELTRVGMNLVSREMEPVPIYLMVAFFYLSVSVVFNFIGGILERRFYYVTN